MPESICPELFELIFERHTSMMFLIDPVKRSIVDVNLATAAFYGYERGEMRGMPLAQINPNPHDIKGGINQTMRGLPQKMLHTHVTKSGEERHVQIHPSPLEIDGRTLIMSTVHDVTPQVQAERELSRHRRFYASVIEQSLDMLLVVDAKGVIAFASPSVENVLGHEVDALQGTLIKELLHPDDIASLSQEHEDLLRETHLMMECRHRVRHASGAWVRISTRVRNLVDDPIIRGFVVNSRDISEEQRLNDELRSHTSRLESSNQDLKEFAYVASHDLQEPLRKIRSFGERLERGYAEELGGRGLDYLHRMTHAADRMSRLIHDLLEYSRLSTQRRPMVELDLGDVLAGVLEDLEVVIQERGAVVDIKSLAQMRGDETMLRQLFQNLLSNAIKFTPKDQAPHISITCERRRRGDMEVLELTVEDDGIGFDQQHASQIFQPFQRLHGKKEYKGTGIGLAICRKIVERHHGTIHAFSSPGDGATFLMTFPLPESRSAISVTGEFENYPQRD